MPINLCNVCLGTGRIKKTQSHAKWSDLHISNAESDSCYYCGGTGKLLFDSTHYLGERATEAELTRARREGIRHG